MRLQKPQSRFLTYFSLSHTTVEEFNRGKLPYTTLHQRVPVSIMDLFGNELMKAPENEEDVNELNDVTFGNVSDVYDDWEWEKDHEPMADVLKSGSKDESFQHSLNYENDDEELELDNDLKSKLSQLVIDDDEEDDDGFVIKEPSTRKAVDLNELFGPSSPPGLFSADELITGVPNIWGSPVRESRMKDDVGGLKNLLQSLQKNPSYEERYFPTSVQQNSGFLPECPKVLPVTAKTLEEIEEEMIHGKIAKTCWRVEEVEKALTAEEVERDLKNQVVSDQARNINHHLAGSPGLPPAELHPNVSLPMLRMSPMGNQVVPASISRSPFPMPMFGRSGPMPLTVIPSPIPGQRPPGMPDMHQWNAGSKSIVHHMMPRHLPPNNLNYLLASRAAAVSGLGLPPNRQILQRPMPGFPHPGVNHLQNLNRNNDHRFPIRPPNFNANRVRPPPSSLNQHYLLQHQQLFQQQQMYHQQQSGYHGSGGGGRLAWPPEDYDRSQAMRQDIEVVDEYAGLMSQREKDWIIKIQLLQLHTDNPYVDDYYFTCWSIKKMLEEKRRKEGIVGKDKTREVTLVLPQLAKIETKAYAPVQFEGSLGKLTASSIHNPRQIIDFHLSQSSEHEDGHHLERKRFKEILLVIEKGYDMLLDIDDIEKKALAQPLDARVPLHEQRQNLIQSLYQRLCFSGEEAESGSVPRTGLSSLISVHKGLLLAIRLLPLLEKADSEAFSCSLLRKLPLVMKKDWQEEDWPRFYNAISQVIQTSNLESLVRFASEINEESCSKNRLNSIMSVIQNKLGLSLVLVLVGQGETIYSTQSPLDLDADEQQKWRAFIELVADALENLDKDMLERPLQCLKNVSAHFTRFLDKRQMLAIEDKLDVVLASEV